jgi:hypothetical protein
MSKGTMISVTAAPGAHSSTVERRRPLVPFIFLRVCVLLLMPVLPGACSAPRDDQPDHVATIRQRSSPGLSVVTNGKFMNVYVSRHPSTQSWNQAIQILRPSDWDSFTVESIDNFTATLMQTGWPTYWDTLYQYSGVYPPLFSGSKAAPQACVDAALHDAYNGVVEWDTLGTLANCSAPLMPQINLIIAPDIPVGNFDNLVGSMNPDMCANSSLPSQYHTTKLDGANFSVLPTNPGCIGTVGNARSGQPALNSVLTPFQAFTQAMSHEMVEILSDPAGAGWGGVSCHPSVPQTRRLRTSAKRPLRRGQATRLRPTIRRPKTAAALSDLRAPRPRRSSCG